ARRGCAGTCDRLLRRIRAGTPPRPALRAGAPSCSAPVPTLPENGSCAMRKPASPPIASPPPKRPARRIMAIWLARLAIDRWRLSENCEEGQGTDAGPLALITETARGLRIAAP